MKNNKDNKGDENETTGDGWRGRREPDGVHDGVLVCWCVLSMMNNVTVILACDGYGGPVASHAHDSLRMGHAREYGENGANSNGHERARRTTSAGSESRWSTTGAPAVRALGATGQAAWERRQHQGHEARQGCRGARIAAAHRCGESECERSNTGARGAEGEREREREARETQQGCRGSESAAARKRDERAGAGAFGAGRERGRVRGGRQLRGRTIRASRGRDRERGLEAKRATLPERVEACLTSTHETGTRGRRDDGERAERCLHRARSLEIGQECSEQSGRTIARARDQQSSIVM